MGQAQVPTIGPSPVQTHCLASNSLDTVFLDRTQLSWFPFIQYNTDWMGREIFHGEPQGAGGKADLYDAGVREGAVGLLFCSIALGVTSFLIPKLCRKLTSRVVWSISNLMVFVLMTAMVVLGVVSMKGYKPSLAASLYVATTSTCWFFGSC